MFLFLTTQNGKKKMLSGAQCGVVATIEGLGAASDGKNVTGRWRRGTR